MRGETLIFISPSDPPQAWETAFRALSPEIAFNVSRGDMPPGTRADWAVVWKPPPGALARMTGLKCIFSLGAGVDHILSDPALPRGIPLSRVVDPYLTAGMSEYVAMHVLAHHRGLFRNLADQAAGRWAPFAAKRADETRVGILGLGELGLAAARRLKPFGYRLAGWSASRKNEAGIESFAGTGELAAFLARTDILVCLLPLTDVTRGILNSATLALLPPGAALINAARGGHLIESDLIAALDHGDLSGATLDVFQNEPLPQDSPLWAHPRVVISPHMASLTDARSTARAMVESMARVRAGGRPLYEVDLARGY